MLLTEWNWDDAFQVCKEESIEIGKLETALNMKNFKMPLEEIAKYTGLPLEKLAAL
jgi:hypothetical protein